MVYYIMPDTISTEIIAAKKYHRRSIRLQDYNYASTGLYFVTICIQDRQCLFGEINNDRMILNYMGKMVENQWNILPQRFSNITLDTFVIMPNHIHGIIDIVGKNETNNVGARSPRPLLSGRGNPAPTLGQIMAYYKYGTTKQINIIRSTPGIRFWQRNFYEHVIRNEDELDKIRQYIANNPLDWDSDKENQKYTTIK